MYKTVYIEYVFIDNYIMNLLILQLSCQICGLKFKPWRPALSACIGALYAVFVFLPQLSWLYSLLPKILLSLVMVFVALGFGGFKKYMLRTAAFLAVTFLFGGIALGLSYGFNGSMENGVVYFNGFSYRLFVVACILAVILAKMIRESLRETKFREGLLYPLKIVFQRKSIVVDAYLDTGNMLCDIYSGTPVIITSLKSIDHILPSQLSKILPGIMAKKTVPYEHFPGIRILPYQSIGKAGFLLGVKPDCIELYKEGSWKTVSAILGISRTGFTDGVEALLHPSILQVS